MFEPDAQFQAVFRPYRRRIQRLLVERGICWGVAAAGLLASVLTLLGIFIPWDMTPLGLLVLLLLGGVAGGVVVALRKHSDLAIALTLERRCDMKERVSTAIALHGDPASDAEFRALVTGDALAHLEAHTPKGLFPRSLARPHKTALVAWGVTLLLFVLPSFDWLYPPQTRTQRIAMRQAGQMLQKQAKELKENPLTRDKKVARQLARNIQRLGVDLQKNRISPKRALISINKLKEEAKKAAQTIAAEQATRDLTGTKLGAELMRQALAKRSKAEKAAAQRARQKMASGKSDQLTSAERKALAREEGLTALSKHLGAKDFQAAAQDLNRMGKELASEQMSQEEREQLAQDMQQLSQALQNTSGQQMSQALDKAAQAMQQGTSEGQQQAMQGLQSIPAEGMSGAPAEQGMNAAQGQLGEAQQMIAGMGQGQQGMQGQGQGNGQSQQSGNGMNGMNGSNGTGNMQGQRGGSGSGTHGFGAGPSQRLPGDRQGNPLYSGRIPPNGRQRTAYSVDVRGAADRMGVSSVPYYDVYQDYRRSAEQAVDGDQYPPDERRRVKSYFDALDPSGR